MSLNGKRLLIGMSVIIGGTLFCFFGAKPEYQEATTFIWFVASTGATLTQWLVNGSHIESP